MCQADADSAVTPRCRGPGAFEHAQVKPVLLLFVKGSSTAFPVMLGVVLAGIALGGLAASIWMRFAGAAPRFAAALAFVAAIATVASYAAFPAAVAPFGLTSITRAQDILDRKSTRLNSSHEWISRMPSSA